MGGARTLHLAVHDGIAPRDELAAVAGRLAAAAADPDLPPTLMVGRLTGAALAFGRFQRPTPPEPDAPVRVRRHTGGRACAYGEGQVSLCLVLPDLPAWAGLPDLDKVVNRCVRGVLKGLGSLGLRAVYGGRDFLTADGRRAALVCMGARAEGPRLFQAVLGLTAPPVGGLTGAPDDGAGPPWAPLASLSPGLDFARLVEALAGGYAAAGDRTVAPAPPVPAGQAPDPPSVPGDDYGTVWGEPVAVPVGTLSVGLRAAPDGTLGALILAGELMVDDGAAAALTRALAGRPLGPEAVRDAVRDVFADPARHAVLGVPDLSAIERAILATAENWRSSDHAVRV